MHKIEVKFEAIPFGALTLKVDGAVAEKRDDVLRIPRDPNDDYSAAIIKQRQAFIEQFTGKKLEHISHYSFDRKSSRATSRTSPASRRCRSALPAR